MRSRCDAQQSKALSPKARQTWSSQGVPQGLHHDRQLTGATVSQLLQPLFWMRGIVLHAGRGHWGLWGPAGSHESSGLTNMKPLARSRRGRASLPQPEVALKDSTSLQPPQGSIGPRSPVVFPTSNVGGFRHDGWACLAGRAPAGSCWARWRSFAAWRCRGRRRRRPHIPTGRSSWLSRSRPAASTTPSAGRGRKDGSDARHHRR